MCCLISADLLKSSSSSSVTDECVVVGVMLKHVGDHETQIQQRDLQFVRLYRIYTAVYILTRLLDHDHQAM